MSALAMRSTDAIAELARIWRRYEGDPDGALRAITETAARALGVARVSVWLLDPAATQLHCADLYEVDGGRHSNGHVLLQSEFPAYFAALATEEVLAADDAHHDPRTADFSVTYLTPLGIGALLDAPIRTGLRLVGVLCHEHLGAARPWSASEIKDASFLASLASLTLELKNRAKREALLEATLESTGEGILACDDHAVLAFNRRFVDMWRIDVDTMRDVAEVRRHLDSLTEPMSRLASQANETFAGGAGETVDVLELVDGRVFERSSRPQLVAADVVGRVWSFRDITLQRRSEAALRASEAKMGDLATRDGLTGLFNRRYILEHLDEAIRRAREAGEQLSIVLLDIDFFKRVNEELGHLVGDAVLRDFARHLQQRLRVNDLVGRYGGEEFVIVLRSAPAFAARRVLEEIRISLGERVPAELPAYTFSAGISELGVDGNSAAEVLGKADERLHEAKRAGRDRTIATS